MPEPTPKTHPPLAMLAIVALSLALNLHALAAQSFWGDEILTASFAAQSPAAILRWTATDIHPPLYYILAGTFTRFTIPLGIDPLPNATTDWLWRFGSVLAVVFTVPVTYQLAISMLRGVLRAREIAIGTALLLCVAPVAIKYGQEARMHALFMGFSALATWLFFRAMQRPRQWWRWLAFALATTANIYTMYFGFLILAAQGGFLVCAIVQTRYALRTTLGLTQTPSQPPPLAGEESTSPRIGGIEGGKIRQLRNPHTAYLRQIKAQLTGFTLATLLAFILYAPWWPVLLAILRKRTAVGAIEGGVGNPLQFLADIVPALGPLPAVVAWGFMALFIIGLVFLARHNWPMAVFAALWLALPAALPIMLGDPRALQFRVAFVLPVYLTLVSYALWVIASRLAGANDSLSGRIWAYGVWVLATLSFVATLGVYHQVKPNWRDAAAYLTEHTQPADIILIGPLWDEGRFIGYYYRGQAQLLTPAAMVTNIGRRAESLRQGGGRVWAVNRFRPAESPVAKNIVFAGVVISEPQLAVYEPEPLVMAAIDLAAQAVDAAYPWAAQAKSEGVLNPDPRTTKAGALRAWGDALMAANRPQEAIAPYQQAVDSFPGWADGFVALAKANEAVGNLPEAAGAYRQAVHFNPKWQSSTQAVEAAALTDTENWPAALELYHQIIGD